MLDSEFGSDLDMSFEETETVTGFFEIELIKENGDRLLIHSKKNGDGFVDNEKKLQKLKKKIKKKLIKTIQNA
jgi:selT/selW/selH-like putative selenoprotein